MSTIRINNLWEKYRIKFIRERKVSWEEVWVLKDVNFNVNKGEVIGVIGQNGAGKTTLLKLIAGMLMPDRGEINVEGKVSALMELGAGFNPEFTGRENITLNARVYGLDEEVLDEKMNGIIEFAGLGKFIDAPIKYYSQGMYMRLAFALAIFVEPDILLIDDIMAVGDEEAQQKCIKKIFELKKAGKTIVLVSHDMNMVSRLCGRVILLEKGRIVREGLPSRVTSCYLETVGEKKGIAVLEKEGLRIIFNNGRLILNYDGYPLTKGMGGYVSSFIPALNSWSSSFNLSWQIKSFGTDKIIAEGRSHEEALSQVWTLQLEKDCLQWQTEIKEEDTKQPHIDLLLMPQYKRWQTLDKSSDFAPFASKSNWQDLGLDSCPDAILGVSGVWKNQECPGLVLEHKNKDILLKPLNTGYEQEARVIQWNLDAKSKNLISIKTFSEEKEFIKYIGNAEQKFLKKQEEERQRLLLEQQAEHVRLRAQRTISHGNLRLFADVEAKSLRLFYKDKEITAASGLHSAFNISKERFTLQDAEWQIQKNSGREMILSLFYKSIPLLQIWTLLLKDENTLEIKTAVEVNKPVFLAHQFVRLELQNKYKDWLTACEKGDFSANQYINGICPIRLKDNKASEVVLIPENEDTSPNLFFGTLFNPDNQTLGIYKRKEADGEYLCLSSSIIVPKKEDLINPGSRYSYFEGKIILGKNFTLEKKSVSLEAIELSQGNLRFAFDQGKGNIFWEGKELTTGLSVYTSVRSSGIWYDSYQARWRLNQQGPDRIAVSGDWPNISISQNWQIELISKNSIVWQVNMEIYEEVSIEIQQINLMLSPAYKTWAVPGSTQGRFPDEYTEDYDILPYRFWYGKAKKITAEAETLPRISFENDMKKENLRAIVENTDSLYQARLLQYQKVNIRKVLPGKYSYFKGIIKIEP